MPANATALLIVRQSVLTSSLTAPIRVATVVLATVLTAAAAQVTMPLPFTTVPFTLTPMVVLLSGAALGSRLGFVSQVLYLLAGAAGLAVFAPSVTLPPGAARLVGPTAGYLWAYPLAAFVTGWLAEHGWDRRYVTSFAAMLIGLVLIFAGGVSWLTVSVTHSFSAALSTGFLPFVPFDLAKVAIAAAILPSVWKFVGRRAG
jgi:biotin transport system substrate-specific component